MTGLLLHIIGDHNPPVVKIAILHTLSVVLVKGGPALCTFMQQFQTTFVTVLLGLSWQISVEAKEAMGLLMTLSMCVCLLLRNWLQGCLAKAKE